MLKRKNRSPEKRVKNGKCPQVLNVTGRRSSEMGERQDGETGELPGRNHPMAFWANHVLFYYIDI
jgi:hypothetical protein